MKMEGKKKKVTILNQPGLLPVQQMKLAADEMSLFTVAKEK